jgi:uncharacterized protein (TIGR03790 family)
MSLPCSPVLASVTGVAVLLAGCGGGGSDTAPREQLTANELAVVIANGDALSESIGLAYQRARGVPAANVIRIDLPTTQAAISDADFSAVKAQLDARLPGHVQATLLTWTQPSRVANTAGTCAMGITSAFAFGYSAAHCGGCRATQASPYYGSASSRPWRDHQIRPSMMLGATTQAAADALIARGVAADGSRPAGSGYLVRSSDAARSVRWEDFLALSLRGSGLPGVPMVYLDNSTAGSTSAGSDGVTGRTDVLFYFTGLATVPGIATNRYLPGAAADHLTSHAGRLPDANGQMPATAWLDAGATASYGTVEEPCNYPAKFPQASVLVRHYTAGDTLIEAYWKSVHWPGQGLFVGEPLARPWPAR